MVLNTSILLFLKEIESVLFLYIYLFFINFVARVIKKYCNLKFLTDIPKLVVNGKQPLLDKHFDLIYTLQVNLMYHQL